MSRPDMALFFESILAAKVSLGYSAKPWQNAYPDICPHPNRLFGHGKVFLLMGEILVFLRCRQDRLGQRETCACRRRNRGLCLELQRAPQTWSRRSRPVQYRPASQSDKTRPPGVSTGNVGSSPSLTWKPPPSTEAFSLEISLVEIAILPCCTDSSVYLEHKPSYSMCPNALNSPLRKMSCLQC